jgi:hypothetical protein
MRGDSEIHAFLIFLFYFLGTIALLLAVGFGWELVAGM